MSDSETTFHVVLEAIETCKRHGIIPSNFDRHKHTLYTFFLDDGRYDAGDAMGYSFGTKLHATYRSLREVVGAQLKPQNKEKDVKDKIDQRLGQAQCSLPPREPSLPKIAHNTMLSMIEVLFDPSSSDLDRVWAANIGETCADFLSNYFFDHNKKYVTSGEN